MFFSDRIDYAGDPVALSLSLSVIHAGCDFVMREFHPLFHLIYFDSPKLYIMYGLIRTIHAPPLFAL